MSVKERVQQAAEQESLVIGVEESLKHIDDIEFLVIASNTPSTLQQRVAEAAPETEIHQLDVDNHELGSLCMKPFAASVVGIRT